MTKSCATHQGPGRDPGRGAALALQGRGAHGALTWGVLDRLLKERLGVHAFCGVSSDAHIGVTLAQGAVRDGCGGARMAMCALWQRCAGARAVSPLRLDRGQVIPLTSRPAVRGYHRLISHTWAARCVAARNSVQPCA
jgi:predicted acylesterase/phospholipase RssA